MPSREQLMREIAEMDQEINRALGSTELPKLDSKSFPMGTWLIAIAGFGWYYFGEELPIPSNYYDDTAQYVYYGAIVVAIFALLSTFSWLFRRRGGITPEYRAATEKVKVLQDRRRELQIRLKELEE